MIRGIVAIDEDRGMGDEKGIPWTLPTDQKFFVDKTATGLILMGYGTYTEFDQPFHDRTNYVATSKTEPLRQGFVAVPDARKFLTENSRREVQHIGGPTLLHSTIDLLDELLITQLSGTYGCTKFLPEYKDRFELVKESEPLTENGIRYTFQTWRRK